MLMMIESVIGEILAFAPDYIVMFGAPELRHLRPKRFLTVRRGGHCELVEA